MRPLYWASRYRTRIPYKKTVHEYRTRKPKHSRKFEIEFSIVYDWREQELPDTFYKITKMLYLAKVIAFLNLENTYIYITRAYIAFISFSIYSYFWTSMFINHMVDMFLELLSKDMMFRIVLKCSGADPCWHLCTCF